MYRIENTEAAIRELQRLLYIAPSGTYDKATKEAVMKMQAKYNLEITGVADYRTFEKIAEEYRVRKGNVWSNDYLFNPSFPFIEENIGDNVEKINYALGLVLKDYTYEGVLPKGKYLGKDTLEGTKYLRKIFGMRESNEIDEAFLNRILAEKRAIEYKRRLGI